MTEKKHFIIVDEESDVMCFGEDYEITTFDDKNKALNSAVDTAKANPGQTIRVFELVTIAKAPIGDPVLIDVDGPSRA